MKNFKFYRFADLKRKTQQRIIIVSFLLFPVMLLIVFSYLPLTQLLLYSFTDWNGTSRNFQFVGFENYAKLWQDPEQFAVLKVSLYYIIGTLIQTALALYFSTILSFKVRFKNFFKAVIFFPYLINGVAIGFIFLLFYRGGGMLDVVMQLCGLGTHIHKWLGEPRVVNWSIVATSIWRYMGFMFVIFYGAIASIPSDIYEAAAIDGANAWQRFCVYCIRIVTLKRYGENGIGNETKDKAASSIQMPPFLLICFFPSRFADREVDRHDETFVQRPVGAEYGCDVPLRLHCGRAGLGLRRAAFREFQRAGALLGVPVCAGAAAAARAGNARYRDRPVGEPPHRAC